MGKWNKMLMILSVVEEANNVVTDVRPVNNNETEIG